MSQPQPITGIDDPTKARAVLWQSGRLVHAPLNEVGLQIARTITGTANKITVTNGDGISGNPTLTIPDAVTLVTPTVTGLLTASGGQIAFPATQNASSNANTLDDYEEGTWTPTVTSQTGSITAYTSSGGYVKVGKIVTVNVNISVTNNGTGASWVNFTLPIAGDGNTYCFSGRNANSGALTTAPLTASAIAVLLYNNTYPVASGQLLNITGFYYV